MTGLIDSLRKTRKISWAPSGWLVSGTTTCAETNFLTITCPDDFYAVRLGFTNCNLAPYFISRAIACSSSSMGDFLNPSQDTQWQNITFNSNGIPIDIVSDIPNAVTSISVKGCEGNLSVSEDTAPSWSWSDWSPIVSKRRTDMAGAPRILMIRVLFPENCCYTHPNGQFSQIYGDPYLKNCLEYVTGHAPADFVTSPREIHALGACVGAWNSPVSCVQFLCKNEGIVGLTTGDSHHQGTTTKTQFMNYLLQASIELIRLNMNSLPIGYWSTAQGGKGSAYFFAALQAVLNVGNPSFVVLPGWSYNDKSGDIYADRCATDLFFSRLLMAAEQCKLHGAVPIFLTPFPRDRNGMTPIQVAPWNDLRDKIISFQAKGEKVLDATALLGPGFAGSYDGTYYPNRTLDDAHPNDFGHELIAKQLLKLINGYE